MFERVLRRIKKDTPIAMAEISCLPGEAARSVCQVVRRPGEPTKGHPKSVGAAGRWFITPHAVSRYRERVKHAHGYSYDRALGALIRIADEAHFVKLLDTGCELWRGKKPLRLRLYVAREQVGKPQLITVKLGHDACVR